MRAQLQTIRSVKCRHIIVIAITAVLSSTLTIVHLPPNGHPSRNPEPPTTGSVVRHRMAERLARLYAGCYAFHTDSTPSSQLGPPEPNPYEFYINRQHRLIWCKVYKAASSSWLYNFNVMAGYAPAFLRHTDNDGELLARRRYRRPTVEQLRTAQNHSITFLIARHPFERLVSAFRDKFQSHVRSNYFARLGRQIVRQFRQPVSSE